MTMADYITRKEAKDAHCSLCVRRNTCYQYDGDDCRTYSGDVCNERQRFNAIKAADVRPTVYGEWEEIKFGPGIYDYYFHCKACGGNTPDRAYVTAPDFCPHCGANMRK